MEAGTYTLLLQLETVTTVEFGAAGTRELQPGFYAYTGSAFGPGGLSRIDRHREVAEGANSTRHWHIDYLLGTPESSWVDHWTVRDRDLECAIAGALDRAPIEGIGATDCTCGAHLRHHLDRERMVEAIESTYRDAASGAEI